jgi:mannose-1-phosphate guanylyltransferase
MNAPRLHAVILAGGSGTRFWPASRGHRPKQFLPLAGGQRTLLQATVERLRGLVPVDRLWIVTNPQQAGGVLAAAPGFPPEQVIVEPHARDTAPCVALAAARIEARDPGAVHVVLPADHRIEPAAAFQRLLERGAELAADGRTLVTFGIQPARPATGFGYIELGAQLDGGQPAAYRVARFREKPDVATARAFVESGRFLWNSGIFVWTAAALLAAMRAGHRDLLAAAERMAAACRAGDDQALAAAFAAAPKTSIDYAVMERAPQVAVVRADLRWDDLGSFVTLGAEFAPDAAGNVQVAGAGARLLLEDARGCVAYAEGRRVVALFGVHDLVVVAVDDAVLVCPKDRAEDLKALVQRLREQGLAEYL